MPKLTLKSPTSGYASATQQLANNDAICDAIENTLSRDGTGDNAMGALIDMNGSPVINLGAPTAPTDAARLMDVQTAETTIIQTDSYKGPVVDIRDYLDASMSSTVGNDVNTFTDVSELVRQAQFDAGALGVPVDYSNLRGKYFLDPTVPITVYKGSGMIFPTVARLQLDYTGTGTGLKDSLGSWNGLCFLVNPLSSKRTNAPVFLLQGTSILEGPVQIAGLGLALAFNTVNVDAYPTITGTIPQNHAPIVACDTRTGKPGGINVDLHIVGVMQGMYLGDPLTSEEPWCTGYNSASVAAPLGKNGAASFGRIQITGAPCKRLFGFARGTSGGLQLNILAIPPYWTGISQPLSGGSIGAGTQKEAALKYFQQNGIVCDMWHRAVGFDITINARGFLYCVKMQAGAGPVIDGVTLAGPNGQDTGKYNSGRIVCGVERVITPIYVDQYSYLHRVDIYLGGHIMDEYNLKGENRPAVQVLSDAAKAGSVDKSTKNPWTANTQYFENDKVSNGGNSYSCTAAGTSASSVGPTGTDAVNPVTDGTCKWIYRNGGFKPFGYPPFGRVRIHGVINEISGGLLENTSADGHLFYNMDNTDVALWKQANGHHAEALIWNKSTGPVVRHMNSALFASDKSKMVYNPADVTRLHVSNNEFFGYVLDGNEQAQIGTDPNIVYTDCNVYDFAVASGDDDDDGTD